MATLLRVTMPSKIRHPANVVVKIEREPTPLPKNWPTDVQFINDQTYSAAVTPDLRDALSRIANLNNSLSKIPAAILRPSHPIIAIQTIAPQTHPAHGECGLFAAQHLPPDSFICLYLGLVHTNDASDSDPASNYDLSYDRDLALSIDSAKSGNESRFANDYRGIAARPNAEFRDCLVQVASERRAGGVKWERRVGIFVLSAGKAGKRKAGIGQGEEILVSYGKGFWDSRHAAAMVKLEGELKGQTLE
ncbi:hypothetical protein BDY17DRAFT_288394 [Neohortaea acidophila]|uniref:SET domain-containing protein n=1 Tax=Neohortaea acidophila TaxID=245834 RepID=A0A6A6Q496_9PEZI|nr:uncharacterized protein BDY17DRAFT_288394 [Neohortaea acidophila]KAF2487125.1 hypothetical protein BDY17DRAFT_288394 [Neohortaea acidophila]